MLEKIPATPGTRKRFLFLILVMLIIGIITLVIFSLPLQKEDTVLENDYKTYCGSCHLTPDPANIPKSLWKNKVLPEMAVIMGYHHKKNTPYPSPGTSLIDSIKWQQIQNYILALAPDSIPDTPPRKGRNSPLTQFIPALTTLEHPKPPGGIVNITFNAAANQLLIGDVYGRLHEWNGPPPLQRSFNSPLISSVAEDSTLYLAEIGIMNPSELSRGVLYAMSGDTLLPLFQNLHRPVYTEINDLNADGQKEILICEFGHYTGALSMLVKNDTIFEKKTLLALPGSIKVEIADMNNDGKKDIIALFSQGREGIYIFYQKENLEFTHEQVIKLGPEYGLSWFSLLDYNKDGHLDIILANGDNADYSNFLKPYHGIRLFINDGANTFKEEWFYPIHGATRVLAEDFDKDGDPDFAVLSFFPDFANNPQEGFVYLENKDPAAYKFTSYITQKAKKGNWLVMDKGDFDQDGDVDILLGNFSLLAARKVEGINTHDLLYLENTAIKTKSD